VELTGRARELRGLRVPQIVGHLLESRGVSTRWLSDRKIMQRGAAMSTGDLPGLLGSAVNKGLLPLFEQARSGLLRVAKRDTVRDFKTASRLRAGEFPALARVTENAEYTSGVIGEQRETFALAKFGRLMGISYESLLADDTAALADMTRSAARAAKERGVTLGNPRLAQARAVANSRKQAEADQTASRVMPVIASIRRTGATSLRAIAAELEARGIRTPRGGTAWTAMAVKRVIDRSAAA